ncbi:MAG TPA: MFS transporter [Solirubrobacterales bacterium]|nr:MFS transporter [Solirubrobacterales bacterium]
MTNQPNKARSNALTMAVLMAGTFVFVLDFFIVNVAIPSTQADLGATDAQVQLIIATYAIAISALMILGGRLGDLFGRRRLFMAGLALFTASSALCGAASGVELLLVGRGLQGIGAALFAPQVLSIIGVTFDGDERRRAVTTYGLTMGLAAAGGQLIGGALIALNLFDLDWRSCYLVNVPIGIAALMVTPRVVPESRTEVRERLDFLGAALAGATLVAIVLPLVEGRRLGWPAWTFACLAAAVPLALAFAWRQRRLAATGGSPLVHPDLFRERAFTVGVLTSVVFYAGMASFFLVLAVYLQEGCGLSALDSGLVFTGLAGGYLAASIGAEALTPRFGRQVPAAGGIVRAAALTGLALTVGAIGTGGSPLLLVPALTVDGIGMGLLTAPLVATVVGGMDPRHAGAASGVLSTANQVGNTIGVAAIGAIFYGALQTKGDYVGAFELSLVAVAVVCLAVAGLVQLLPGRPATVPTSARPEPQLD